MPGSRLEELLQRALTMQWRPPPGVDKHDLVNNSGTGGPVPAEVGKLGWCWGAMVLGPLWALAQGLWWLAGIELLPVFGWGVLVYMGYAGHGLAWQSRRFVDVRDFTLTMRAWNEAGLFMLVGFAVVLFLSVGLNAIFGIH